MKRKELIAAFKETLSILAKHGATSSADHIVFFTYALSSTMRGHVKEGEEKQLREKVFNEITKTMNMTRNRRAKEGKK